MKNKILIIEDEELISKNIHRILSFEGYDCELAENGLIGIDKSSDTSPDLILCDIMMPKLDGYNVLYELKRKHKTKNIPFIFLSAKSDRASIRQGMEGGADDYIVKPFKTNSLLKTIKLHLQKKEDQQKLIDDKLYNFQDSFFKNINHEFYTPLNGILGLSSILINNYKDTVNPEVATMLEGINESGERLYSTLQRLVLYAKLSMLLAHKTDLPESKLITKELLLNRIKFVAKKENRESDLSCEISSSNLRLSEDYMISLIDELISNAFKFSSKGNPVLISSYIKNGYFVISVHNHGSYLSTQEIKNIGPFVQFNKEKLAQQGVGLGLIIVKQITKLHDGLFKIMSTKQQGTEVLIKFPIT